MSKDTDRLEFNTAIAQMMIFLNEVAGLAAMPRKLWTPFVLLLSPYAPHLAEELWAKLGQRALHLAGAVAGVDRGADRGGAGGGRLPGQRQDPGQGEHAAGNRRCGPEGEGAGNERIREILAGKEIRKVIVVPNKLVNIVAAL